MEWNEGFSSIYYCTLIDAVSWRDLTRFELTAGSVTKTTDSLMESADLSLTDLPAQGEAWIRVYLDARQNDTGAHEAVFTGLMSVPAVNWDGNRHSYNVECYSVLKPADDILLQRGWYAPAGSDGARLAAELLGVGAAPVEYEDTSPILNSSIIAEDGESNLSMAWKIIEAIGWRIRISGSGSIRICPKSSDPVATLDALENDCVELAVTDTRDMFSCPNVFRATYNELTAVARDEDPNSPLSTVSRGREVWKEEKNCALNSGESIGEYALRRLKEEQSPARTISYTRRYHPEILPGDAIRMHYPAQNVDGLFRVTEQQIDLGYGARTSEGAIEI